MICLNSTDTLEGGASVNAVVDYTVHGLVGTAFTQIAQGQLSNTNPSVLYTAGAAISVVSVIYVNTHSAAVTVDLYLDPANAGTPRRMIPKALTLGIGYSAHFDGARLSILDAVGGLVTGVNISDTAFAASWDGVTTIAPSKNAVYDAMTQANIVGLKTTDSPTFVGETLSGLTASLPVFTGASKELVSKSVADTQTALEIPANGTFTDYTATSTVVGWLSFVTKAIWYKQIGKIVFVWIAIYGTSNSTGVTFSLPSTPTTGSLTYIPIFIQDNGASLTGRLDILGSATFTAYANLSGGGWTASGTKGLWAMFQYMVA